MRRCEVQIALGHQPHRGVLLTGDHYIVFTRTQEGQWWENAMMMRWKGRPLMMSHLHCIVCNCASDIMRQGNCLLLLVGQVSKLAK